jgi:hypothetical protein
MAKKKPAGRAKAAAPKKKKPATNPAKASKAAPPPPRVEWFDAKSHAPLIEQYARQLDGFLQAMADGIVEEKEVKAQEKRLVTLMKEVEPLLNNSLHNKVTQLLCELTAYDLMQVLYTMHKNRPQTTWRG